MDLLICIYTTKFTPRCERALIDVLRYFRLGKIKFRMSGLELLQGLKCDAMRLVGGNDPSK